MPRGGTRTGAGRKAGIPNKASVERQKKVAASGQTPLDYMLEVMRDRKADLSRRDEMAKAAAPYVHPRLASMQHRGAIGTYDLTKVSDEELDRLEAILGPLALAGGDQGGEGEAPT